MAEAAKNICMERLMARVTVIGKKEKDEEPQRRTEQTMDRLYTHYRLRLSKY